MPEYWKHNALMQPIRSTKSEVIQRDGKVLGARSRFIQRSQVYIQDIYFLVRPHDFDSDIFSHPLVSTEPHGAGSPVSELVNDTIAAREPVAQMHGMIPAGSVFLQGFEVIPYSGQMCAVREFRGKTQTSIVVIAGFDGSSHS